MGTTTKTFGSSSREGHDSSSYYSRKIIGTISFEDHSVPVRSHCRNEIFNHSSEYMHELPSNSVGLMITSPPYNVGKDYDEDLSLDDYFDLLRNVFEETYRVLEPGGRACINIANLGRKPYIPLSHLVTELMLDIGYLMRGEIIWQKAKGASGSCAWGSYMSASNPVIRDLHEYILVFSKGRFDRARKGESTITGDDFMRDTLSIWEFRPESASKVGHPAPFPILLPSRLINLYSYEDDLILDPFMGSGTTCVAAQRMNRDYIGYDTDKNYVEIAQRRLHTLL